MRLAIRFLGLDFLTIEASTDDAVTSDDDGVELAGGTLASMPIGFTSSWGDQRWEQGVEQ